MSAKEKLDKKKFDTTSSSIDIPQNQYVKK